MPGFGLSEVIESISFTRAPSKLRRSLQRTARDRETLVKCYGVVVERHERLAFHRKSSET